MEKFNFDFSKPQDQKKFEKAKPEKQQKIIEGAELEAYEDVEEIKDRARYIEREFYDIYPTLEKIRIDESIELTKEEKYDFKRSCKIIVRTLENLMIDFKCKNLQVCFGNNYSVIEDDLKFLAEYLERKGDFFLVTTIYEFLNDTSKVKELTNRGVNEVSLPFIIRHGDDAQIKKAIDEYMKGEDGSSLEYKTPSEFFHEKELEINDKVKSYCKAKGILLKQPVTLSIVNEAMEISRRNYDVTIGVLNSGTTIPAILEIMGRKVFYLEWHKNDSGEPEWRNIGASGDKIEIPKGAKILLCEHDTHTGATLEKLASFLEKFEPEFVDVSFIIDAHKTNEGMVAKLPFYRNSINPSDLTGEHLYDNLMSLLELLRSKDFKNKLKK